MKDNIGITAEETSKVIIAVIDTGYDFNNSTLKNVLPGVEIYKNPLGKIIVENGADDDVGHGTIVTNLIVSGTPNAEIFPVKITRDGLLPKTDVLAYALQYLYENVPCDIINISAGITCCDDIESLCSICNKLHDRNISIVSAYDNLDAVAYPAAFDCVIGVSGNIYYDREISYKYVDNDSSNFVCRNHQFYIKSINGQYETVSGNSFLAAEFSCRVAKIKSAGIKSHQDIVMFLKEHAYDSIRTFSRKKQEIGFSIQNAIVFPFNKEMHSIASFRDSFKFSISGFYDTKYSGNVGKKIAELVPFYPNTVDKVENIDSLDWNGDFDTVILGHTTLMSVPLGIDFETAIVQKCISNGKNIFSCRDIRDREDIQKASIHLYTPHIDPIERSEFYKMHVIGCPIVGVVGTGGSQGKFTLQVGLRQELLRREYKVGQLGTEPTSLLFDMDAVFPIGHESAVYVNGFEAVAAINTILGDIEKKSPDIILFGNQANTIPLHARGPQDYPVRQQELLLGCQADAYILCVNEDAPPSYIKRTVSYLESLYPSTTLAIAISPRARKARWSNFSSRTELISKEEEKKMADSIRSWFQGSIVSLRDKEAIAQLTDCIIDFFSEKETP